MQSVFIYCFPPCLVSLLYCDSRKGKRNQYIQFVKVQAMDQCKTTTNFFTWD